MRLDARLAPGESQAMYRVFNSSRGWYADTAEGELTLRTLKDAEARAEKPRALNDHDYQVHEYALTRVDPLADVPPEQPVLETA